MPTLLARLIDKAPLPARRRRKRLILDGVELAARIGYGARGFVYLSAGAITLLALLDVMDGAVGARGALVWLAQQPFGRVWLMLAGLGLTAFAAWRFLQAVFDADHEGRSWQGINTRVSQGFSGLGYAVLAATTLGLLLHVPADPGVHDAAESHRQAARVLALPFGNLLLAGLGTGIAGVGVANIVRAVRTDFTAYLACSARLCRRVAPLARAGYLARGLAWLPLAALVIVAGARSRASDVASFDAALDAVEGQPAGRWFLALAALGFLAFGVFSFVEARFRRIRAPREIVSG